MYVDDISGQVSQWLRGDDNAFEAVFYHYRPRLLQYAMQYVKHREQAADIAMEALIKIWQKRKTISPASGFEAYLFTIARHLLIKEWQQEVDRLLLLETAEDLISAATGDPVLYKELELRYRESLNELPEQRRRIFLLHREGQLSYRQIAEQLQISPRTVENQISTALKFMRLRLSQYLHSVIL